MNLLNERLPLHGTGGNHYPQPLLYYTGVVKMNGYEILALSVLVGVVGWLLINVED
jgi:hypothetical protein